MGVDLQVYRGRIGAFDATRVRKSSGTTLEISSTEKVVAIATLLFVLLVVSGSVESNPGPTDGSQHDHEPVAGPSRNTYICEICGNNYAQQRNLTAHIRTQHEGLRHSCPHCGQKFTRLQKMQKHSSKCGQPKCSTCGLSFATQHDVDNHRRVAHVKRKQPTVDSKVKKPRPDRRSVPTELTERDTQSSDQPDPSLLVDMSPEMREVYTRHYNSIKTKHQIRKVQDLFNYELTSNNTDAIQRAIWSDIFDNQTLKFKINYSFSFILQNVESGERRFYHASLNNSRVLDEPAFVGTQADFSSFVDQMQQPDILEWAKNQRPNSKWVVDRVCSVTFFVNKMADHPIGGPVDLPNFIVNKSSITCLQYKCNTNSPYTDQLCLFRCLALHNNYRLDGLEKITKKYFYMYSGPDGNPRKFKGVRLSQLCDVENIFNVNINVYSLEEGDSGTVATLVQRSIGNYDTTMYLNIYDQHFSYINDFSKYASSYACRKCKSLWTTSYKMNRHEKNCTADVKHVFPGGVYHTSPSIFDKLADEGIFVDENRRYFPYRITFDYECYLDKNTPAGSNKVEWVAEHKPLSVSICSNVDGYTAAKCFVTDGCSERLVANMMNYLQEIRQASHTLLLNVYQDVIRQLDAKIKLMTEKEKQATGVEIKKPHPLEKLMEDFRSYLSEIPVIGFNSGRYDLNIIKTMLIKYIDENEKVVDFVVKRNQNFMALKTSDIKFLDILNFLAPGFTYDKFLKAYGATVTKGFFPYEYIDCISKLKEEKLPPHSEFFNKLKNCNISSEDYEYCQQIWKDNDMKTMEDFLRWYNNRDVQPMIEAIDTLFNFYKLKKIDMFKDGISVPGLTLKYLFSYLDNDTFFTLFDESNKDLYHLLKNNIVGGPSIIFNRYHENNITTIRDRVYGEHAKKCRGVTGYDANSLYLWAISQDMPTGSPIRRRPENSFAPERTHKYGHMAVSWLEWLSRKKNIAIQHKENSREKRIGQRRLPVDGWCQTTQTIYQFHGCRWHGHQCYINRTATGEDMVYNEVNKQTLVELRENTKNNTEYMRKLGYNVIELYECEWYAMQRDDRELKNFVKQHRSQKTFGPMSEKDIIDKVKTGELFGLIEIDIVVPNHLKPYFEEMTPIFKNTSISREDIGEFMQDFAKTNNIMSQPRRSLIGSYFGDKILLATPLLRWYLNHGLEVTKVHQVVEYVPKPCFEPFSRQVSHARRSGDTDERTAIIAETMKLIGNSAYGKTVTNKFKHRDIKFCTDRNVSKMINKSQFRQLNQLDEGLYEIELSKSKIKLDLPIQIGFFVYQLAKLRMLEFYFDFIDVYVDWSDFEYCEMDTDSAYIAFSSSKLEDIIKPHLKTHFFSELHNWLPSECCDIHRPNYIYYKSNNIPWNTNDICCKNRQAYDKRTPGLFKEEWTGDGIVGLCSKTYFCFGKTNKITTKGLNKYQNKITKERFMKVLTNKTSDAGVNMGFRVNNNKIYTYIQCRDSLSYFYPKRKVCIDGRTTIPLDI